MCSSDLKHGWKISLSFNISQKDDTMPCIFKKILGCGNIRYRKDGICYFEVRKLKDIVCVVIPFFRRFSFFSKKRKYVFDIFSKIVQIVDESRHLSKKGMKEILDLRDLIKVSRKRKYSKTEILNYY